MRACDQTRLPPHVVGKRGKRRRAHRHAAQIASRLQRAEQAGVFLVAGQDLVTRAEVEAADDGPVDVVAP